MRSKEGNLLIQIKDNSKERTASNQVKGRGKRGLKNFRRSPGGKITPYVLLKMA